MVWTRALAWGAGLGCALTLGAAEQPVNDDCGDAIDVSSGTFPFETSPESILLAEPLPEAAMCETASRSIWYKMTPAASGAITFSTCAASAPSCTVSDTVLAVYSSGDGTCGTLAQVGCSDDACATRSETTVNVSAGAVYYIQVARFGSSPPPIGSHMLSVQISEAIPPPADRWVESGDAGDLPATAQAAAGTGTLGSISGALTEGDRDMYLIDICNVGGFSATTVGGTNLDTQLFLFDQQGVGVTFSDDATEVPVNRQSRITGVFVPAPGRYYLALSLFDSDPLAQSGAAIWLDEPYAVERRPDGPAAASALSSWSAAFEGGPYILTLTGACFITNCGTSDFDRDGDSGTDADIEAFFACLSGTCCATCATADFDADGDTGTDADIEAFFRVLSGGTC